MSRSDFSNDKYNFAVGADYVTGAYFQVWDKTNEDQPIISVDNQGVRVMLEYGFTPKQHRMITQLERRFAFARIEGNEYPNVDADTVNEFAEEFGFNGLATTIFEILD